MKKVLSLLVTFVLLQSQSWALSGGPVYPTSAKNYKGTYSGVLIPDSTGVSTASSSAAVGLFSLAQPSSGLATGAALVFINGTAFTGTIQGIIDPKSGKLSGVIDAVSTYDIISVVGTTTVTSKLFATGSIKAKIVSDPSFASAARIEGTSSLDVSGSVNKDGTPIISSTAIFQVDGFQQSTEVAATTTITFGTGN